MIDSDKINIAITNQIAEAVRVQVQELFTTDSEVLAYLKVQASNAIAKRFMAIDMDTIVDRVLSEKVAEHVADQYNKTGYTDLVNADIINQAITKKTSEVAVDQVKHLFNTDSTLQSHLKAQAIQAIVRQMNMTNDVEAIIANKIAEQFATTFNNTGIHNKAPNRELTVLDKLVVIENELVARNAKVLESFIAEDIVINGELIANGSVNPDAPGWADLSASIAKSTINEFTTNHKQDLVDSVLNEARTAGFDFDSVTVAGKIAIEGNSLSNHITESNLRKVGQLSELTVKGETLLADTVYANSNRVGINTTTPTVALDIWDDEVEIIAGKIKSQTAFIGTARSQDLTIGVNRRADITVDLTGTVTIQKLKVNNNTIAFSNSTPGYKGNPGDVVYNTAFKLENPVFAWHCMHDFSWVPLRAVI